MIRYRTESVFFFCGGGLFMDLETPKPQTIKKKRGLWVMAKTIFWGLLFAFYSILGPKTLF